MEAKLAIEELATLLAARFRSYIPHPKLLRYGIMALLGGLLMLQSGCIFSPKKGKDVPPPPKYFPPSTPEIVMQNLATAYAAKDSAAYKACYDPRPGAYIGTSLDQTDPSAVLDTLYYTDEARHIAAIAKSTTISSVDLELRPNYVRSRDEGDPVGWALIQNPIFRLEINDGPTQYIIPVSNETIEFRFIPTVDRSSPTDTLWHIIRWIEVRGP